MKNKKVLLEKLANKTVLVKKIWWSPFSNIEWRVLGVRKSWNLSDEEYAFLTNNKYLTPQGSTDGDEVILVLSEKALNILMSKSNESTRSRKD